LTSELRALLDDKKTTLTYHLLQLPHRAWSIDLALWNAVRSIWSLVDGLLGCFAVGVEEENLLLRGWSKLWSSGGKARQGKAMSWHFGHPPNTLQVRTLDRSIGQSINQSIKQQTNHSIATLDSRSRSHKARATAVTMESM
jgi:hypothetical protein